jgi:hypothetical protein
MNSSRRSSANAAMMSTTPNGRPVPMPNTPRIPTMSSTQRRTLATAIRPKLRPAEPRQALPRPCQSEFASEAPVPQP